MTMHVDHNKLSESVELISTLGFDGLPEALKILLNEARVIERSRHLQAEHYERTQLLHGLVS